MLLAIKTTKQSEKQHQAQACRYNAFHVYCTHARCQKKSVSSHISSMSGSQVHEYHKLPSTNPSPFLPRHQLQATRLPHHPSTAHHPASRRLPRRRASTRGPRGPRGARQARRQRVPGEGREGEIPILGSSC